jgi:hypothetical protein
LVLVLEFLDRREPHDLGRVEATAIADLLADPVGGEVELRRRGNGVVPIAPAVGVLPHAGDVLRVGGFPPVGVEYRL